MEGRLVAATLMRLAERDQLDPDARTMLKASIELLERLFEGLGFCLSEDGDLLSQWRGYADDARGVAMGFRRPYLEDLASSTHGKDTSGFSMHRVDYDTARHEAEIEPTYAELRKLIDAGAFKYRGALSLLDTRTPEEIAARDKKIEHANRALMLRIMSLSPKVYQMKAPAFREEREWRLVSIRTDSLDDPCQFRAAGARVIPYRIFELAELSSPPISEVILGPRHETPPRVIQALLQQHGLGEVQVRRSAATYR